MRWTIRNQIFVPFAALLAIAVATSAVTSSVLSARRAGTMEVEQLARVPRSLDQAGFPYSANVLERMKGLSGAEFVAVDEQGRPTASTLHDPVLPDLTDAPTIEGSTTSLSRFPSVQVGELSYLAAGVPVRSVATSQRVYVLYPQEAWVQLQRSAAWPPLAIGGGTLVLMLLVSGWLAHRFGQRIESVRRLFAELQAGRHPRLDPPATHDELRTLVESANELSARLESLQSEIRKTERLRVLAQLAGGFAHQLRNAVTGARMAVQLHQRLCDDPPGDDSLSVALAQLKLTEQQVQGLLSLSREQTGPRTGGELGDVLREVESLLTPHCRHLRVSLEVADQLQAPFPVLDRDALRAALLNLGLNALEAAGPQGEVSLSATDFDEAVELRVVDNGPGPPAEVRERVFEPFVTSKPEGVGLGLALAQQAAELHQGTLSWSRLDGRTMFKLRLPRSTAELPQAFAESEAARIAPLRKEGPAVMLNAPSR